MKEEKLNIEDRLETLKSRKIFKVPENYFENFSVRLKERIDSEKKPVIRFSWINEFLRPALGIAAVLAVLFLLVYVPVDLTLQNGKLLLSNSHPDSDTSNTGIISDNDQLASFETLTMLPQSQFLSALEEVDNHEDITLVNSQALEEYLTDNSSDYEMFVSN